MLVLLCVTATLCANVQGLPGFANKSDTYKSRAPNASNITKIWNPAVNFHQTNSNVFWTGRPEFHDYSNAEIAAEPVPSLKLFYAPSLQWHVGIYAKTYTPYMQVCGGSLVKADVVLSAAHCFWKDGLGVLLPGFFAVAAGKLLRPWQTEGENYAQHSEIRDIKIPPRFQGGKTSFQDDIAIVFLAKALEYAPGVRPVCVSFDMEFDQRHLMTGNLGKVAGWGLTEPNGRPSQRLTFLDMPYVDIEDCIKTAPHDFLKYITSDKICAGDQKTGRALCRGDSGGGLVFYSSSIPFLHGIASTAPKDDNECNAYAVATFTHVLAHRRFLLAHVPDIGVGCEKLYSLSEKIENSRDSKTGFQPFVPTLTSMHTQAQTKEASTPNHTAEQSTVKPMEVTQSVGIGDKTSMGILNSVSMAAIKGQKTAVPVDVRTFICNCHCHCNK